MMYTAPLRGLTIQNVQPPPMRTIAMQLLQQIATTFWIETSGLQSEKSRPHWFKQTPANYSYGCYCYYYGSCCCAVHCSFVANLLLLGSLLWKPFGETNTSFNKI